MAQLLGPIQLRDYVKWPHLFRLLIFNVVRLFVQGYILYSLLYAQDSGIYPKAALVISLISNIVATCFGVKMLKVKDIDIEYPIPLLVLLISVVVHHVASMVFKCEETLVAMRLLATFTALIFIGFQTMPLLIQFLEFIYACLCKRAEENAVDRKKYYEKMESAGFIAGFLTEMECYLRAAPQEIVQLAVIFYNNEDFTKIAVLQQISIVAPFALMPWFITSFQSTMKQQKYKTEESYLSKSIYWTATFCIMFSRICSIASAAAFWPEHTALVAIVHWTGATIWVYSQTKTGGIEGRMAFLGDSEIYHPPLCMVFGIFYIFKPMNLGEESSRNRYICFYVIYAVENIVATWVWSLSSSSNDKIGIIGGIHGLFIFGIALLIVYYKIFHPKVKKGSDEDVPNP